MGDSAQFNDQSHGTRLFTHCSAKYSENREHTAFPDDDSL